MLGAVLVKIHVNAHNHNGYAGTGHGGSGPVSLSTPRRWRPLNENELGIGRDATGFIEGDEVVFGGDGVGDEGVGVNAAGPGEHGDARGKQ